MILLIQMGSNTIWGLFEEKEKWSHCLPKRLQNEQVKDWFDYLLAGVLHQGALY